MAGYVPFEAVGPASIDHFFFGIERGKNETFSTYITAIETALQEVFTTLVNGFQLLAGSF